jgi:hypothetical protein
VSKVFHSFLQLQDHLSSLRGDQPQSGQRMRGGSDEPNLPPSSTSRSGTTTRLSATGPMPSYYDVIRPLWSQEEVDEHNSPNALPRKGTRSTNQGWAQPKNKREEKCSAVISNTF